MRTTTRELALKSPECCEKQHGWTPRGKAVWEIDVLQPGDYHVELSYSREGSLVWGVDAEGGQQIQNQQNSSHNYQRFPMGWIHFAAPGCYKVGVSYLEGKAATASLKSNRFSAVSENSPSQRARRAAARAAELNSPVLNGS